MSKEIVAFEESMRSDRMREFFLKIANACPINFDALFESLDMQRKKKEDLRKFLEWSGCFDIGPSGEITLNEKGWMYKTFIEGNLQLVAKNSPNIKNNVRYVRNGLSKDIKDKKDIGQKGHIYNNNILVNLINNIYIVNFNELVNSKCEQLDFHLLPLVPKNKIIIIGGRPDSCKSLFSLLLGISIASGQKFLNTFETKKARVLYVDAENGLEETKRRIQYFYKNADLKDVDFKYVFATINEAEKIISLFDDYDVVIFDSLRRFLKGKETDSETINKFYQNFLFPLREQKKTVILIHHFRKKKEIDLEMDLMEMFRGSSDILAMVDFAYCLQKVEYEANPDDKILKVVLNFYVVKNRAGIPATDFSFVITKNDKKMRSDISFMKFERILSLQERLEKEIAQFLREMKRVVEMREIKDMLVERIDADYDERTLRRALKSLCDVGKIIRVKRGHYQYNPRLLEKFAKKESEFKSIRDDIQEKIKVWKENVPKGEVDYDWIKDFLKMTDEQLNYCLKNGLVFESSPSKFRLLV